MQLHVILLIVLAGGALLLIGAATHFAGQGSLDNIKAKTVGDGQHGTARWATPRELKQTYRSSNCSRFGLGLRRKEKRGHRPGGHR